MKILYSNGRSPRVIKTIQCVDAEHKDDGAVEDDYEDDYRHNPHQGFYAHVTLAVVRRAEDAFLGIAIHLETTKGLHLWTQVHKGKNWEKKRRKNRTSLRVLAYTNVELTRTCSGISQ